MGEGGEGQVRGGGRGREGDGGTREGQAGNEIKLQLSALIWLLSVYDFIITRADLSKNIN